jgi:hypothetical protein
MLLSKEKLFDLALDFKVILWAWYAKLSGITWYVPGPGNVKSTFGFPLTYTLANALQFIPNENIFPFRLFVKSEGLSYVPTGGISSMGFE